MRDTATATVKLVYLARLREAFGAGRETFALPDGDEVTIETVLDKLRARGGSWAAELAPGRAVRVAINHEAAPAGARVRPGDEIALFPPVTGG